MHNAECLAFRLSLLSWACPCGTEEGIFNREVVTAVMATGAEEEGVAGCRGSLLMYCLGL